MHLVPRTNPSAPWIPAPIARHPALLASACVCIGVFVGDALDARPEVFLAGMLLSGILGVLLCQSAQISRRLLGNSAIALALIALGAWRIAVTNSGRPSASLVELTSSGRSLNIFARIDGVPFQKSSGWRVPLDLIAVKTELGDRPVDGRVLMTSIPSLQGLRYGDYIRFDGRVFPPSVQRNPGGFDYAEYLYHQGFDATVRPESDLSKWPQDKHWSLYNIADPVRQWIRETFDKHLDDKPQALLVGLLLGDTDRLPKPIYNAFRESGTSHLLAVSGANVWLIVGMILLPMYVLSVPRWPRTIIAVVVIVFFSFLTRNEPSVVRASLMVALILAGKVLWRPVAPINAVGAAGWIILLFSPSQLFRPGFQLSFAAVIGILVAVGQIEPRLRGLWRQRWNYTIILFLVASIAATIATAPISAWHFGTVPVAGLLSNLVMVPLAGLTAHLGLLLLPLQVLTSSGSSWLAWAIDHLLSFSTRVAQLFADFSWATLPWPEPSLLGLGHLAVAVVLLLNWNHRYQWLKPVLVYACIVMSITAVARFTSSPRPHTSISLLDTGLQRVAVMSSVCGTTVGIIDDPGLDDELDQWTVQPFLRNHLGMPSLDNWTPWRRLSEAPQLVSNSNTDTHTWTRFYSTADLDSLGRPRVWADRWESDSADIVMVRDVPRLAPAGLLSQCGESLRSAIMILPAEARTEWIREVIDSSQPTRVVLYGRHRFGQSPTEALEFWKLRFPDVEFFSSAAHGAIVLELVPAGVILTPTVTPNLPLSE